MGKRVRWDRIKHAYVTGSMSYREIGQKYGIPVSTIAEVGKKEKWPEARKQFRNEVATEANARAREEEVDKLANIKAAADEMGAALKRIMADERQLYMHTAVTSDAEGMQTIEARQLEAVNKDTLKAIASALKDMTAVLRNLHDIQTVGEKEQLAMARERLELEKRKAEEQAGDKEIVVKLEGVTGEEAE